MAGMSSWVGTSLAVVAVVCALAACGGSARTHEAPTPVPEIAETERQARDTIEEMYQTLRRGNPEGLLPLLAEDVFVAGPGAGDVFLTRTDALVALSGAFDGGRKHKLRSRDLRVVASPSGQSAWAADQIEIDGTPFAIVVVLASTDDLWFASAIHVARPVPAAKQKQLLASGRLAPPAPLAGAVSDDARAAVTLFEQGAPDRARLLEQLADHDDTVVIGSGPREVTRGTKVIRKRWKKTVGRRPLMTMDKALRARATPDGAIAWVCANVQLGAEGGDALPHRSFSIYRRGQPGWQLMALQDAVVAAAR
jgi:ketosteroid isomerase-like protein